jgi:DNA end-binding protein Ku
MRSPGEIRDPSELAPKAVELTDDEVAEAQLLIDRLSRDDLDGPEFEDHYTDLVGAVIKAKREVHALVETPEQGPRRARSLT